MVPISLLVTSGGRYVCRNDWQGQDKVSFGNAVVQRLKDKLWPGDIKFSIDNFSITLSDTGEVLYLDNSYSDWVSQSDAITVTPYQMQN